jgi:plasmid stabilization system protein ParE
MAYRVIFRRGARDEAIAAAAYIAEHDSADVAARWYAELEAAVASLAQYPGRCELAREYAAFPGVELRQLVIKSHRLIFSVPRYTCCVCGTRRRMIVQAL